MKGIPIKFRGITVKYKEVVYGHLFHCGDKAFIMSLVFYTAGEWEMQTDEVDPDSVAQLVGYDADGNEVYEGDILCAPYGAIKNFQAGVVILQAMCDDFGTKIVLDYDSIKDNKLILKKGNGNE